jgi:hypothetical protein
MATPMMAGAAALVKAKYKTESADQIVARLYASADTTVLHQASNTQFVNQMGAGRVDVAKALSYKGPSFRVTQFVATTTQGYPLTGTEDSIQFSFTIKNWLNKASSKAYGRLKSISTTMPDPNLYISLAGAGPLSEVKGYVTLKAPANLPDNISTIFRFTFRDSGYVFAENRVLIVANTTINWQGPNYTTTSTSTSNIGYLNYISQGAGVGIRYKNKSNLYEGGFLFALSGDTAYSCVRGNPSTQDRDFVRKGRVRRLDTTTAWRTEAYFIDSSSTRPIGLKVKLRSGCGLTPADSNIIYYQAALYNTSTFAYRQAYWGFYGDWDLAGGGLDDQGGYMTDLSMPFMRAKQKGYAYYGLVPLSHVGIGAAVLNNYGNAITGQPNINDGFSRAEKSQLLRSGIQYARQMEPPAVGDCGLMLSQGPFTLLPGDSIQLAQAIVFGLDSASLIDRAKAAKKTFEVVTQVSGHRQTAPTWSLYPNPAQNQVVIESDMAQRIRLMDMAGRVLKIWDVGIGKQPFDLGELQAGLYALYAAGSVPQRLLIIR